MLFEVPRVKNLKRHSLCRALRMTASLKSTPKVLIYFILVSILQKSPKVTLSVGVRST